MIKTILAVALLFLSGCATVQNSNTDTGQLTVKSGVDETFRILERRATLNDTSCKRTALYLTCEMLEPNGNNVDHQFIQFTIYTVNKETKVDVTRWVTVDNVAGKTPLKVTDKQIEGIAYYIEYHRNKNIQAQ